MMSTDCRAVEAPLSYAAWAGAGRECPRSQGESHTARCASPGVPGLPLLGGVVFTVTRRAVPGTRSHTVSLMCLYVFYRLSRFGISSRSESGTDPHSHADGGSSGSWWKCTHNRRMNTVSGVILPFLPRCTRVIRTPDTPLHKWQTMVLLMYERVCHFTVY